MARYTNIVSFNDVKQASRYRRALEGEENERFANERSGYVYYDLNTFASPKKSKREDRWSKEDAWPEEYSWSEEDGWPEEYSYDAAFEEKKPSRLAALFTPRESAPLRKASSLRESASPREERRNRRAKSRADKLFDRQYAAEESFDEVEGAPRAALYEAEMGSSHRKAARMQRASEAGSSMVKFNPAGWFSNLNVSPRSMKVATAALCLVLAVVFLYAPAQHYYQSVREHDRLAAEYASVEERNATIAQKNESLASNAGMEDAVREKYGYVVSGENVGVVTGLSDATVEEHRAATEPEANVLSSSVKAPEEWYTPYLDALFGVS